MAAEPIRLDYALLKVARDLEKIRDLGVITMQEQTRLVDEALSPLKNNPEVKGYMEQIERTKKRYPEKFEDFSRTELAACSVLPEDKYVAKMFAYYLSNNVTDNLARERYGEAKWIEKVVLEAKKSRALETILVSR